MEQYIKNFLKELKNQFDKISWKEIALGMKLMQSAYEHDGKIFLIGNGGSAAIATHFANDLNKTVFGHKGEKTVKRFQAISLSDNVSALTAWANDVGFEDVFAEQLRNFGQDKDILIAISSSGNSPNIIKAVAMAKNLHMSVVGISGFTGGKLLPLSDAKILVPANEYEIVESAHEAICHLIITYFKEVIK